MLGVVLLVVIVIVWTGLYVRSEKILIHTKKTFKDYSHPEQKMAIKKYKRNLQFIKFTKKSAPKLALSLAAILFGAFSGTGPIPFFLLVLYWWLDSGKPKKYKKPKDLKFRELDEWVIIANQTILNK